MQLFALEATSIPELHPAVAVRGPIGEKGGDPTSPLLAYVVGHDWGNTGKYPREGKDSPWFQKGGSSETKSPSHYFINDC